MKKVLYAAMLLIVLHYLFVSYVAGLIYPNQTGYIMKVVDNNILVVGGIEGESAKGYKALWITVPLLISINHDLEVGKKVKVAVSSKEIGDEVALTLEKVGEEMIASRERTVSAKGLSTIPSPKPKGSTLTEHEVIQLALQSLGNRPEEQAIQDILFNPELRTWQVQFVDLVSLYEKGEGSKVIVEIDDQQAEVLK